MNSLFKRESSCSCSAFGCSMRMGTYLLSPVKLFKFPKNPEGRKQWEIAVNHERLESKKSFSVLQFDFVSGQLLICYLHCFSKFSAKINSMMIFK